MAPAEPAADHAGAPDDLLSVEVASSPGPRQVSVVALRLARGATVADALRASGHATDDEALAIGIWGRKTALDTVLREGDRVECYRPLKVDPKEARRVRYRAHGEKLPKGIHRPRGREVDLTQAPGRALDEPAD
jgi:putative ubiquitin-RnfH superfamily antitoxin RatB of RatAB toxin-antitoxin module